MFLALMVKTLRRYVQSMKAKILSEHRYLTVSTVDNEGNPWASPVWYVTDENDNYYWWSPVTSQHSRNIENNPSVYITIFNPQLPEGEGLGLYIKATACKLPDNELDKIIELYNSTTKKFKMTRENCSGEAPTRLYKAIPSETWYNDGIETDGYYTDVRQAI